MSGRRINGEGSVYQRKSDGLWVGAVTLGYDENGHQRRKTVSAKTRSEALAKVRAVQRQVDEGVIRGVARPSRHSGRRHVGGQQVGGAAPCGLDCLVGAGGPGPAHLDGAALVHPAGAQHGVRTRRTGPTWLAEEETPVSVQVEGGEPCISRRGKVLRHHFLMGELAVTTTLQRPAREGGPWPPSEATWISRSISQEPHRSPSRASSCRSEVASTPLVSNALTATPSCTSSKASSRCSVPM
jgi:hypothetical protein